MVWEYKTTQSIFIAYRSLILTILTKLGQNVKNRKSS